MVLPTAIIGFIVGGIIVELSPEWMGIENPDGIWMIGGAILGGLIGPAIPSVFAGILIAFPRFKRTSFLQMMLAATTAAGGCVYLMLILVPSLRPEISPDGIVDYGVFAVIVAFAALFGGFLGWWRASILRTAVV